MAWTLDARIPVRFISPDEALPDGAALLSEGEPPRLAPGQPVACFELPATGHSAGCPCCAPRSPAAPALDALFLMRVRGEVAFFREVAALARSVEGAAAIRTALEEDAVVRARYRRA